MAEPFDSLSDLVRKMKVQDKDPISEGSMHILAKEVRTIDELAEFVRILVECEVPNMPHAAHAEISSYLDAVQALLKSDRQYSQERAEGVSALGIVALALLDGIFYE